MGEKKGPPAILWLRLRRNLLSEGRVHTAVACCPTAKTPPHATSTYLTINKTFCPLTTFHCLRRISIYLSTLGSVSGLPVTEQTPSAKYHPTACADETSLVPPDRVHSTPRSWRACGQSQHCSSWFVAACSSLPPHTAHILCPAKTCCASFQSLPSKSPPAAHKQRLESCEFTQWDVH